MSQSKWKSMISNSISMKRSFTTYCTFCSQAYEVVIWWKTSSDSFTSIIWNFLRRWNSWNVPAKTTLLKSELWKYLMLLQGIQISNHSLFRIIELMFRMWKEIQTKAKYVLLQSIFMAKIAMTDKTSTTTSLDEVTSDTFIDEGPPSKAVLQRWDCIFDICERNGFIWKKNKILVICSICRCCCWIIKNNEIRTNDTQSFYQLFESS